MLWVPLCDGIRRGIPLGGSQGQSPILWGLQKAYISLHPGGPASGSAADTSCVEGWVCRLPMQGRWLGAKVSWTLASRHLGLDKVPE